MSPATCSSATPRRSFRANGSGVHAARQASMTVDDACSHRVGIVVIGRNEGARLRECLGSVRESGCATVYVDSGSVDNSAQLAAPFVERVIELDSTRPFSAARARNEGF